MHIIVPNYLFAIDMCVIPQEVWEHEFSYVWPIKCHVIGREFRECVAYFDYLMLQAIVASAIIEAR